MTTTDAVERLRRMAEACERWKDIPKEHKDAEALRMAIEAMENNSK